MKRYVIAVAGCAMVLFSAATSHAQQQLPTAPETPLPARSQEIYVQSTFRPSSLSIILGWGSPYGWGLEYSHLVQPNVDVNVGLGLGISGGKIGIGARYYLTPQRRLSPFFGANLVRSGRIDNVELSMDNQQTAYSIRPTALLHLRSGLRWQPGHVGLIGTLGYGARLGGDPIVFDATYPAPSPALRNLARALGPGGLEVSLGLIIGLGR